MSRNCSHGGEAWLQIRTSAADVQRHVHVTKLDLNTLFSLAGDVMQSELLEPFSYPGNAFSSLFSPHRVMMSLTVYTLVEFLPF